LTAPEEEDLSSQPEFWFEFPVLSRFLGLEIGQYTPKSMGSSSLLLSKKIGRILHGFHFQTRVWEGDPLPAEESQSDDSSVEKSRSQSWKGMRPIRLEIPNIEWFMIISTLRYVNMVQFVGIFWHNIPFSGKT